MNFNIGGFIGSSVYDGIQGSQGVSLTTIENHPQPVNIKVTYGNPNPTDPKNGTVYQVTNPNGVVNVGADQGYAENTITKTQAALFFAHTWEINDKLTFDWGVRYENIGVKGQNNVRGLADIPGGGLDGNPLTLFDNSKAVRGATYKYDKTLSYVSYSKFRTILTFAALSLCKGQVQQNTNRGYICRRVAQRRLTQQLTIQAMASRICLM